MTQPVGFEFGRGVKICRNNAKRQINRLYGIDPGTIFHFFAAEPDDLIRAKETSALWKLARHTNSHLHIAPVLEIEFAYSDDRSDII